MLRVGNAKDEAIDYAKTWTCPVCARKQRPKTQRPAKAEKAERFNDKVCIDTKWVHNADGKKFAVSHAVDEATYYHVAKVIPHVDSETSSKAFHDLWVKWAGAPKKITYDQGGEFKAWFEQDLDKLGVDGFVVPTESAWMNPAERHGAI